MTTLNDQTKAELKAQIDDLVEIGYDVPDNYRAMTKAEMVEVIEAANAVDVTETGSSAVTESTVDDDIVIGGSSRKMRSVVEIDAWFSDDDRRAKLAQRLGVPVDSLDRSNPDHESKARDLERGRKASETIVSKMTPEQRAAREARATATTPAGSARAKLAWVTRLADPGFSGYDPQRSVAKAIELVEFCEANGIALDQSAFPTVVNEVLAG